MERLSSPLSLFSKLQSVGPFQHLLHTHEGKITHSTETPNLRCCEKSLNLNSALLCILVLGNAPCHLLSITWNSEFEWVERRKKWSDLLKHQIPIFTWQNAYSIRVKVTQAHGRGRRATATEDRSLGGMPMANPPFHPTSCLVFRGVRILTNRPIMKHTPNHPGMKQYNCYYCYSFHHPAASLGRGGSSPHSL